MNIKKGDQVKIISGKDRGKTGSVLSVNRESGRIVVKGVNTFKKRVKPTRQRQTGEIVTVERSLRASNAMVLCGNCKKGTRVGFRIHDGKKTRYCKKCDASL